MRRPLLLLAIVGGVTLPASLPRAARACVRTTTSPGGPCLYWGQRSVPIYVNQSGSDDVDDGSDFTASEAGVARWTDAACSDFAFDFRGLTSRTEVGFRVADPGNLNLIVWRESLCRNVVPASDPCWACFDTGGECCGSAYDCWEHPRGVIAVTTTTFSRITGSLVDADIELNGVDYWFTALDSPDCRDPDPPPRCAIDSDCLSGERCFADFCLAEGCVRTDIENTVTHEVGHIVGLDHSADPVSTMYASAPEGETLKRSLEDDDLECFCGTYPEGAATVTCFAREVVFTPVDQKKDTRGCGGCQSDGAARSGEGALLLVGLFGLLLLGGRRMWRLIPGVLLLLALPSVASAHLLTMPPDLDAWIAKGEILGLARATEAPRPCGAEARPAIQVLELMALVDTAANRATVEALLHRGEVEVLLLDDHTPTLAVGEIGPVVLAPSEELATCSVLPEWRQVSPGPQGLRVEQDDEWPRYLRGVSELPSDAESRRAGLKALWTRTLQGSEPALIAHATARLAGLGALPDTTLGALARLASDPEQDRSVRLRTIRMAGLRLPEPALRALLRDPDLEIIEATLGLLREAPPELLRPLAEEIEAMAGPADDERPRAVILRTASLAVLSGSGNPVYREVLAEAAEHRLFKARHWAVLGLGILAARGDLPSRRLLERRQTLEPDARIREVIRSQIGSPEQTRLGGWRGAGGEPRSTEAAGESRTHDLGWRMLFVLLGLLALAGMLLLPRFRPPRLPPTH